MITPEEKKEFLGVRNVAGIANGFNFNSKLLPKDLDACVKALPDSIKRTLQSHPGKLIVAGGFIRSIVRGEPINDIDIFGIDYPGMGSLAISLDTLNSYFYTPNAKSIKVIKDNGPHPATEMKVQFITKYEETSAVATLQNFDFTHSMAAFWFENDQWTSVCHNNFYNDVCNSLINFNPEYVGDRVILMKRFLKFSTKGWQYCIKDFAAILAEVSKEPIDPVAAYKLLASTNYGAY